MSEVARTRRYELTDERWALIDHMVGAVQIQLDEDGVDWELVRRWFKIRGRGQPALLHC